VDDPNWSSVQSGEIPQVIGDAPQSSNSESSKEGSGFWYNFFNPTGGFDVKVQNGEGSDAFGKGRIGNPIYQLYIDLLILYLM
jgi:hypothetical protein